MHVCLLHHLLEQSARNFPDNVALVCKNRSETYTELEKQSNALARKLLQLGVKSGDRVGILLAKSIESIVSIFGILKAGAIYVPLDPTSPTNRVVAMIRQCGIECLITGSAQLDRVVTGLPDGETMKYAVLIGEEGEQSGSAHNRTECLLFIDAADEEDSGSVSVAVPDCSPAYILHTSGSTGKPKGVALSHLNALTFVSMAAEFFGIRPNDRFCNHAPLHFDLSVFDIFVAIKCGAAVVLLPEMLSTFPFKLAEYISKEKITVWNSVSSVLSMLAEKGVLEQHYFDSLRIVHFSGDVMPVKHLRILTKNMNSASFYNIYGQTEANSSLFFPIQDVPIDDFWKIPIGTSFPNFDVFAVSDTGGIIHDSGEEGELHVSGSTVALGYWGEDLLTGEKFVPDPRYPLSRKFVYKTGDLCRIDDNGNYVFIGRKDQMVKSRGYRIELAEIEMVLSSHPNIMTAVAVPIPDDLVGNRIAAVIVAMNACHLKKNDVIGHCAARLPKYMIPEILEFRDVLPLTASGKVDRKYISATVINGATKEG